MTFFIRCLIAAYGFLIISEVSHASEETLSYLFSERKSDRSGIRTNVLIVLKDNKIVFEKYADGFSAYKPYLLW